MKPVRIIGTSFSARVWAAVSLAVVLGLATGAARGDSIVTRNAYLPAVHVTGATGVFRTDVTIFNPEPSTRADVSLYFTPADRDGTTLEGIRIDPPLAPRESVTLDDVVSRYFHNPSAYGMLEVRANVPVMVTSNTYNVAGDKPGTYGNFSPGQPLRNALGFDDSIFGNQYVTGLPNNPSFRVNAAVMNPSDRHLEAGVQLVDEVGNIFGTRLYDVPPYSMTQLNDIFGSEFASFGPPQGGPYRLNVYVNLNNGALVLAYATVTDKRTGDPYLIPGQPMRP